MTESGRIPGGEIAVDQASDGVERVAARLECNNVRFTKSQMADLFGRERLVVAKHVRNVFREGELDSDSALARSVQTAADGKTYQDDAYNLDVNISVGDSVKYSRGTRYRIWATRP